jgi:hypothetical protein
MKETNENMKKAALMKPKTKNDAVWLAGLEICGFINFSGVARKYFNRTAQWLTQRLHGNEVNGKPAMFKPEEAKTFANALRDMAARLIAAADRIDQAPD